MVVMAVITWIINRNEHVACRINSNYNLPVFINCTRKIDHYYILT